jgi:hypothetical protein
MIFRLRALTLQTLLFTGLMAAASQTANAQFRSVPSNRSDLAAAPCGPDWVQGPFRYLVPQGFMGADFRSACQFHDQCYYIPGVSRAYCDREFYRRMSNSCSQSAWPGGCRFVAGMMHGSTRLFGGRGYADAQRIGRSRSRRIFRF